MISQTLNKYQRVRIIKHLVDITKFEILFRKPARSSTLEVLVFF